MNDNWVADGNDDLASVFAYGPEAYDAVILLALAALEAGSTEGVDIAAKLQEVSGGVDGGTKCTTFAECADIIIGGGQADYDGVSGPITFNEVGDPTEASIQVYEFINDNTSVPYAG
jgi:branched-chain amino acid transport system substrate-binding protein